MDFESACAAVAFATMWAGEGCLSRVNQLVGLEVTFGDEALSAVFKIANERTLTSMDSQMCLEIASLLEFS